MKKNIEIAVFFDYDDKERGVVFQPLSNDLSFDEQIESIRQVMEEVHHEGRLNFRFKPLGGNK